MVNGFAYIASENFNCRATNEPPDSLLQVVILAAGASKRLGQPKQLVVLDGEPLLRRQCRLAIESRTGPVGVILGCHARECTETIRDLPVVKHMNLQWAEGMASSMRQAVHAALVINASGLLLLHADQYRLTTADLQSLKSAWMESRLTACAAMYADDFGPPVIIPRNCFSELLQLKGDVGARRSLAALPAHALRRVPMPNAIHDLDIPDQLANLAATNSIKASW